MRSALALLLAALFAGAAWWCASAAPDDLAASLPGLTAEHEDTRTLPAAQRAQHATRQQAAWRERATLLAAALALGAASQAFRGGGRRPSWQGALGVAALGLFGWAAFTSMQRQAELGREGRWAVGDDSLPLYAAELTPRLREWCARIGPDDAVLLTGRQDRVLNVVATALHPRALYPLLHALPPDASADALREIATHVDVGRGAPRRWLVDLDGLASPRPEALAHPLLLELDP